MIADLYLLIMNVLFFRYMTMMLGDIIGKVAVLRTFRVFRALKTVAVVPGVLVVVI